MLEIWSSFLCIKPNNSLVSPSRQNNLLLLHPCNSHNSRWMHIPVQRLWFPWILPIFLIPKYNGMITAASDKTGIFPGHERYAVNNTLKMRLILQESNTSSLSIHKHIKPEWEKKGTYCNESWMLVNIWLRTQGMPAPPGVWIYLLMEWVIAYFYYATKEQLYFIS